MSNKKTLTLLNLNKITSSNNFKKNKKRNIPIKIGIELNSGTLKLVNKINLNLTKTPHKWLIYNEPEFHLNKISKEILNIKKKKIKNILCTTYKDVPLASRVKKIINKKFFEIFTAEYFFNDNKKISIQEILKKITFFSKRQKKYSKIFDVILMRHVWEHIYDQKKFVENISLFSDLHTLFYFEVPDCERLIKKFDYTMIWEEHVYYYTQTTFLNSLTSNGFQVIKFLRFKENYEDILCAVAIRDNQKAFDKFQISISNQQEINSAKKYAFRFSYFKKYFKKKIMKISQEGDIVVYGASHMFNIFFNIFKIETFIKYIVDDNKYKLNKFMFEKNVVIKDFNYLKRNLPKSCIIAINPMSSSKFKLKLNFLKKNNVRIFSIFDKMNEVF